MTWQKNTKIGTWTLILLVGMVTFLATGAFAAETNLTTAQAMIQADTYVNNNTPEVPYGSDTDLEARDGLISKRVYIKVNTSSLGDINITSAMLYLNLTSIVSAGADTNVTLIWSNYSNWTENAMTWNNQLCGGVMNSFGICNSTRLHNAVTTDYSTGLVNFSITNELISVEDKGGLSTFIILLTPEIVGTNREFHFKSKENTIGVPYVNITYSGSVPEPLSFTILHPVNGGVNNTWNGSIYFNTSVEANVSVNNSAWSKVTGGAQNKTFWYNYTLGQVPAGNYTFTIKGNSTGYTEQSTSLNFVLINSTFTKCSDAVTTPALNFTCYDEINLSRIQCDFSSAEFTYWAPGFQEQNQTFTFTGTNEVNYTFCIAPPNVSLELDYTIPYTWTGYSLRQVNNNGQTVSSSVVQKALYLLQSASAGSANIRALNSVSDPIQGVYVTMSRDIAGISTIIESRFTDSAGIATFSFSPLYTYDFELTKSGYTTATASLNPVNGETYNIQMAGTEAGQYNQSPYLGITYTFIPTAGPLNNGTFYNFSFNLTSSYWPITECIFSLLNTSTGTTIQSVNASGTTTGCYASINMSTSGLQNITARGSITENYTTTLTYDAPYFIRVRFVGDYSMKKALDDMYNFGGAGWDRSTLALIAFIITFAVAATAAMQEGGAYRGEMVVSAIWVLTGFFSYLGWYTLENIPNMPTEPSWLPQYIIFILISCVWIVVALNYMLSEGRRG